ncbi:MAG TPA: spermidine synthase [Rubrivivax sp.]|nr:spermidine synthase [Rubrivivax sp.]
MTSTRKPAARLPEATISEYDGVRSLHLGTIWIQGSMRIQRPDHIELEYVQRMLAALLWLPVEQWSQGRAVQLGLGAAAITRFTHKALRMQTTAVELNPSVIALCRRSFRLPADGARLQVLAMDAADWVRDPAQQGSVQLLHVDLYDHEAAAPVLDDAGFYAACRGVLAEGGVMGVNLFGRDARFEHSLAQLVQAFGAEQVCPLRPTREGNRVVLAGHNVRLPDRAALLERAAQIESRWRRWGLPARKWLCMLRPLVPQPPSSVEPPPR